MGSGIQIAGSKLDVASIGNNFFTPAVTGIVGFGYGSIRCLGRYTTNHPDLANVAERVANAVDSAFFLNISKYSPAKRFLWVGGSILVTAFVLSLIFSLVDIEGMKEGMKEGGGPMTKVYQHTAGSVAAGAACYFAPAVLLRLTPFGFGTGLLFPAGLGILGYHFFSALLLSIRSTNRTTDTGSKTKGSSPK